MQRLYESPLTQIQILMSQPPQSIVIISGNPLNAAIAAVLPLFLDTKIILLDPRQLNIQPKIPKRALLILNDTQISHLPNLRLHGFAGAVLTICTNPHRNPLQTHRILRWGENSHATFTVPYNLPNLLQAIAELVPLEPENLTMLQNELTAPKRWFQSHILPALKRLTKNPKNTDEIATLIAEIRSKSPVACHATIEIAGHPAQIQQHFSQILDQLQSLPHNPTSPSSEQIRAIEHLKETFEQWRDLTLSGGEGIGTFSSLISE